MNETKNGPEFELDEEAKILERGTAEIELAGKKYQVNYGKYRTEDGVDYCGHIINMSYIQCLGNTLEELLKSLKEVGEDILKYEGEIHDDDLSHPLFDKGKDEGVIEKEVADLHKLAMNEWELQKSDEENGDTYVEEEDLEFPLTVAEAQAEATDLPEEKKEGTVKVTIRLPREKAEKLSEAFQRKDPELATYLDPLELVDVKEVTGSEDVQVTDLKEEKKEQGSDTNSELINEYPQVTGFFDEIRRCCEAEGFSYEKLITPDVVKQVYQIAKGVESFYRSKSSANYIDMSNILQTWDGKDLTLKGDPDMYQGFYIRLQKIQLKEGQKPGALMFAFLPQGHTAPTHIHKSPAGTKLPGEITMTLQGELKYFVEKEDQVYIPIMFMFDIVSHTKNDLPRIADPESLDQYLVQDKDWVGFYIQFAPCELTEK